MFLKLFQTTTISLHLSTIDIIASVTYQKFLDKNHLQIRAQPGERLRGLKPLP